MGLFKLLGVLFGVVVAEVDADVADVMGSGHSKATGSMGSQHVSVIESKCRRAIIRGEGGLDVGHNEHFLPLYERVDSPTFRLLDRELLQIAGLGHLRNGRWVEALLEDLRPLGGIVLIVLIHVWRSVLATTHNRVESDDEVEAIHCTDI